MTGPTGLTGATGAFPSHTGCTLPYVPELDPDLIQDCQIPEPPDPIWESPVFPPIIPPTKTTQPQIVYAITDETDCPQKAKQVRLDGTLVDPEENFECLEDSPNGEPRAIPVLTADGKTVLFRGGGGGVQSILGVVVTQCVPGPALFNRIEVFDDGSWSPIIEETTPVVATGVATNGDPVLEQINTTDLTSGMDVVGPGVATGTAVATIDTSTSLTLNNAPTVGGTGVFTFTPVSHQQYLTGYILDRY